MFCIIPCRCLSSSNMVAKLGPSPAVFSSTLPLINGLGDRTSQSKNGHWRASATRTATATATATKTSLKKWICAASNFIALVPSRLIVWMLANFFEADSKGLYQSSAKKKGKLLSCVSVLDKSCNQAFSRPSRAVTAKKWIKKLDARAKLLFCQSKPSVFLPFSLTSPKSLL